MPKRSIVIADDIEDRTDSGNKRSRAVRSAGAFFARRLKTGIEFLYVEDVKMYPFGKLGSFNFPSWHFSHEELIEEIGRQFPGPVTCLMKSGPPAEKILQFLNARPLPELIVMGTRGRKGMKRLFLGSIAEEVIRRSRRPVMVIGPAALETATDLSGRKRQTILVPTDLGKNSRRAERYALSLAKRMDAGVTLFHCLWDSINAVMVNTAYSSIAAYPAGDLILQSRDEASLVMKQKTGFFRKHGVPCDYKIEDRAVTSTCAVSEECGQGYSFAVMGTHGRNAVLNAFFGSTARETLLNAPIPVIVVHSGD